MDGENEFNELMRQLEARTDEHVRNLTDSMESALGRVSEVRHVPAPLDWHPAYAHQTFLIDWLNEAGPLGQLCDIRIPIPERLSRAALQEAEAGGPIQPAVRVRTLTRQRCAGPAPYVGEPFVYAWNAAIDEFGRAIAGESWIQYV